MLTTCRKIRRSLIVLATIVGASLVAGDASACSMKARGEQACDTVCGCCTPESIGLPALRPDAADPSLSATLLKAGTGCEAATGLACSCRAEEPTSSTPLPSRTKTSAESRIELSTGSASGHFSLDSSSWIKAALLASTTQSPSKTPLYLRNERLLF